MNRLRSRGLVTRSSIRTVDSGNTMLIRLRFMVLYTQYTQSGGIELFFRGMNMAREAVPNFEE